MTVQSLREAALQFYRAGLAAADPYAVVTAYLQQANQIQYLAQWPRIHPIAVGKAACAMLEAVLEQLPAPQLALPALAITNDGNQRALPETQIWLAGHPLPDQRGLLAAERLRARLQQCQPGELLLLLLSGGGSAMLPDPAEGISLADKLHITELLLASGANIGQINCVRKHCSRLKGGGLARLANGATVLTLALSDVIDDDPSSIASGPSVADPSTFADAINLLQAFELWPQTPPAIQKHLLAGQGGHIPETLKPDDALNARLHFKLLASNRHSVSGMESAVGQSHYQLLASYYELQGEATKVAGSLAEQTQLLLDSHPSRPWAWLGGGETTVTLGTQPGCGGRNQELALAFALRAETLGLEGRWCLLSAGSDGRDGPTTAAGGLVDQDSLRRMRQAGIDPALHLAEHNSHPALLASQDLVMTGATGTNVADLQLLLWEPNT